MNLFSNDIERAHWQTLHRDTQRSLGQWWTPYPVARFMAAWVAPTSGRVLDPAAGSGVFARALADPAVPTVPGRRIECYDLDPGMVSVVRETAPRLTRATVSAELRDSFTLPPAPLYGGIIANPPYLRHGAIADKARLRDRVLATTGVVVPAQANLYAYFLADLTARLAPGGRMAAIVPSEFLDSSYARPLKRLLLGRGLLCAIVSFDAGSSIFEGALTTAAVLLLERDVDARSEDGRRGAAAGVDDSVGDSAVRTVSFARVEAIGELEHLEHLLDGPADQLRLGRQVAMDELDPDARWRRLFEAGHVPAPEGFVPLSTFVHIRHGITTGCNGFFVLRERDVAALGIPREWLVPVVGRSSYAREPVFTPAAWARARLANGLVWLLAAPPGAEGHPAFAAWAASPAGQKAQLARSLRGRRPWFRQAAREPGRLWVSNLSRGRVKLVRNLTEARTLDAFHVASVRDDVAHLAAVIEAYWTSSDLATRVRSEAREYGNGLLKAETAELLATPVPDLRGLAAGDRFAVCVAEAAWRGALTSDDRRAAGVRLDRIFDAAIARLADGAAHAAA